MYGSLQRVMTGTSSEDASEKLELFISCRNLADLDFITVTDSFLVIKLQELNKPEKTILKTKVYWNDLNPDYAETVTIDFFFEIRQKLKFEVYHEASPPKLVGLTDSALGQIFGAPAHGIKKDLLNHKNMKSGEILIRCEKVNQSTNQLIEFRLQATNFPVSSGFLCFGWNSTLFYRIYRKRQRDELIIYESEVSEDCSQAFFNNCKISERRLCKNNPDANFEIRFYHQSSNGNHILIGRADTNVNSILDGRQIPVLSSGQQVRGTIRFVGVKRYIKNTFTDYLAAGLQLMLITCIDFTASNGSPKAPTSLHYISQNKRSTYEQALDEVSRILLDYDYDKLVPVYGFGAKCSMPTFNSMGKVSHCFPLNGNEDNAHVFMVQGIINAYRNAIQYLQFGGPTYFHEILDSAIAQCREIQKQRNQYMIVFILTDGEIHDKAQVIDQIIQCCSLPISLIIVGVGNGPFDIMNEIDDDDCQLVDSKGRKTTRDLVQFVEFRKFQNNGVELAREVLEELPRQVEEYFQMMNIGPGGLMQTSIRPSNLPPLNVPVVNPYASTSPSQGQPGLNRANSIGQPRPPFY